MAKPPKFDQGGKIKVRIVEFEMDGSDESLQEGLKTFAAALSRGSTHVAPRVKSAPSRQITNGDVLADSAEPEGVEEVDTDVEEDVQPAPRAKATRKPGKVVPATILTDIRLDDVDPTFKDFATDKAPTSDLSKYLVVAYWYKTYKGVTNLTGNHFYTAYRMAGWRVPKDCAQPARDLRAGRLGKFSTGSEPGTFMINQVGENSVIEMGE